MIPGVGHAEYLTAWWTAAVVCPLALAFPVYTLPFWPWWDSWWGRNIAAFAVCFGAGIIPAFIIVVYPPLALSPSGSLWVNTIPVLTGGVVLVWRTIIIWRTQVAGARRRALAREREEQASHADGG